MKVLVTGGSGGIGSKIVDIFRINNHEVIAPNRSELDLNDDFILSDVEYDIIINNAGINPLNPLVESSDNNVLKINYLAPLKIITQCLPYMVSQEYGRIVNIGSIWIDNAKPKRSAYSASKTALHSLTKSITCEYSKYNILANTISPGFIGTELTFKNNSKNEIENLEKNIPIGRLGFPDEIAKFVYYLTVENTYISGQNIVIDGGYICTRY